MSQTEPQLGKARAEPLELKVDSGAAHYFFALMILIVVSVPDISMPSSIDTPFTACYLL